MNISQLVSRIKKDLGLYGMALPVKNIDTAIVDVIHEVSLVTFSILHPKRDSMAVDLRDLKRTECTNEYNEYIITGKNNTEIAYVEDVRPDVSNLSGWNGYNTVFLSNSVYQNIIGNAQANLAQQIVPKMTFHFDWPNKLKLYNELCSMVIIEYGAIHDLSLVSVPPTVSESFYKLAVLDVKQTFYNLVKHYNELQTAHGRIDLKIDDWAEAASRREELVNNWEDVCHLDQKTVYWA